MFLCRVFVNAVVLLNLALELVALPGNFVEIVVGKFTPLLLDFSFQLLPVSFDDIPIHCKLLSLLSCKMGCNVWLLPICIPKRCWATWVPTSSWPKHPNPGVLPAALIVRERTHGPLTC